MKLAEALKMNHRFVVYSYDVAKNIAVYLTDRGPIFAVYGSTGAVTKYIKSNDGSRLTKLECSPNLRSTEITDDSIEDLLASLKKKYKTRNADVLHHKIMLLAKRLEDKTFRKD